MGQVQNDRLYIRYKISSLKDKANKCKMLEFFPLLIFSLPFFADEFNSKTIVCMRILQIHVPSDCSAGIFLYWVGAAYELRLASYGLKTVSKNASCAPLLTSEASVYVFQVQVWYVSQATAGILNVCTM